MVAARMSGSNPLADADYVRQRLSPQPGDPFYLHLADLRAAVAGASEPQVARLLDFGCGGSPYRSLFSAREYHRADLAGTPGVDFTFGPDSHLPRSVADYDLVLSTQVLEHVAQPAEYLAECRRVLRPGGRLLLTTHGTFRDHNAPGDYQRWTADGLRLAVREAGFVIRRVQKLTTGPRAILFLLGQHQVELLSSEKSWGGLYLRLLRAPFRRWPAAFARFCDRAFSACQIVDAAKPGSTFYLGLLVEAVRPD